MKRQRVIETVRQHIKDKRIGDLFFVVEDDGVQSSGIGWRVSLRPGYPPEDFSAVGTLFAELEEEIDETERLNVTFLLGLPLLPEKETEEYLLRLGQIRQAELFLHSGIVDLDLYPEPHFYQFDLYNGKAFDEGRPATQVDVILVLSHPQPFAIVRNLCYIHRGRYRYSRDRKALLTEKQVESFLRNMERINFWNIPQLPDNRPPCGFRWAFEGYTWGFEGINGDSRHRFFRAEPGYETDPEYTKLIFDLADVFIDIASVYEMGPEREYYLAPDEIIVPWGEQEEDAESEDNQA